MLSNKLYRALFPLYKKSAVEIHKLDYLFLELTQNCNLNCIHCGSDCQASRDSEELLPSDIYGVLKEIGKSHKPEKVFIVLSGGEPLCYTHDVFKICRNITDMGFPCGMVSNGLGWNKKVLEKARHSGIKSISISLDGLEQSHNWLRNNPQAYTKAINAIKMLLTNPFIERMDVITCVTRRSLPELDEMYNLLVNLDVPAWRMSAISPIGRAARNRDLCLDGAGLGTLFGKIKEFRQRNKIWTTYSEIGHFEKKYEHAIRDEYHFCRAGISIAGIMCNGDILACSSIPREFAQGNIKTDKFMEVWNNGFEIYRNRDWLREEGKCKSCNQWKHCLGGGFHLIDPTTKTPQICYYNQVKNYEMELTHPREY